MTSIVIYYSTTNIVPLNTTNLEKTYTDRPLPRIHTSSNTHTSGSLEEPPPGHCSGNSDGLGGHVGIHNGMGHEVSDTLMEGSVIVILCGGKKIFISLHSSYV